MRHGGFVRPKRAHKAAAPMEKHGWRLRRWMVMDYNG
jgi:hypothetical protein